MSYRPTIRYPEEYKAQIDTLFESTHLDRNQILRAVFHVACHSKELETLLEPYVKANHLFPMPSFDSGNHDLWLATQDPTVTKIRKQALMKKSQPDPSSQNREREFFPPSQDYNIQRTAEGGISIKFG